MLLRHKQKTVKNIFSRGNFSTKHTRKKTAYFLEPTKYFTTTLVNLSVVTQDVKYKVNPILVKILFFEGLQFKNRSILAIIHVQYVCCLASNNLFL